MGTLQFSGDNIYILMGPVYIDNSVLELNAGRADEAAGVYLCGWCKYSYTVLHNGWNAEGRFQIDMSIGLIGAISLTTALDNKTTELYQLMV